MQHQRFRVVTTGALTIIGLGLVAMWGGYVISTSGIGSLEHIVSYAGVIAAVPLLSAALLGVSMRRSSRRSKSNVTLETFLIQTPPLPLATQNEPQPQVGDAQAIAHMEVLRKDVRGEIKQRIQQRDTYSIQLTFGLGALLTIALAQPGHGFDLGKVLLAAPLITIYFTVLILYSYRLHKLLALYLRDTIEPELARLCGTPLKSEWEHFYALHAVPGIRKAFFLLALWVVTAASLAFLWDAYGQQPDFSPVLGIATVIYTVAAIGVTLAFWKS
jgi:hypothetical protein